MTLAELTEKARQRANTAGAPDVLNFLRNHVAKVRGGVWAAGNRVPNLQARVPP
jgi:hypothetical protein